jgi:hypothetical protein
MKNVAVLHTFHIPVMGIGFTIDTPLKVAPYGITSTISLLDDILIEKMREFYCMKFDLPFKAISDKIEDYRAKRITAYLNFLDKMVKEKFEGIKHSFHEKSNEFEKYIEMLPDISTLKQRFKEFVIKKRTELEITNWGHQNLQPGSIDVNIMTKLDRENYNNNEKLPVEFNDAHAAMRGFAESNLESGIVLSAGINPRLYSYMENFEDFFPNENGEIRKKIILKISDYKSAFIQGKFLANKGLWVSEFRVESGLNCGGHAFATDGYLLGPILEEFKEKRETLFETLEEVFRKSLVQKGKTLPKVRPEVKITAQGGVGTAEEHQFLIDYYQLNSIGWGSPFLLVPEATNVDENTQDLLCKAKEKDIYLSHISPLGVRFNSLRGNTKDNEKKALIDKGKPGSTCPKRYASLSKEYTEKAICTASYQYQRLKIKELENSNPEPEAFKIAYDKIVDKSCLCVGLGTSALIVNNLDTKTEGPGVSVCPGPNMAYFSKVLSLKEMIDHIYGKKNYMERSDRPNLFIKELDLYIDFLAEAIQEAASSITDSHRKHWTLFRNNLIEGINYYKSLFQKTEFFNPDTSQKALHELKALELKLEKTTWN